MMPSLQHRVVKLDNARFHGGIRSRAIDAIVMHCTAGASAHSSIVWMNRPDSAKPNSYAYIIDRDGAIYRHCAPAYVAYHAGDSALPATLAKAPHQGTSINSRSLGIAWANLNDGEALTPLQIESALWLCAVMMEQYRIPLERVVGHYEVSPKRKTDPKPAIDMIEWRSQIAAYLSQRKAA